MIGPARIDESHPLDEPLGYIHELAIRLEMAGMHDDARRTAEAYGQIQRWVIDEPDKIARRCAEMVKRGADIQRVHAERCKQDNRWKEKTMSVSESGTEAYLTAANALDFWEYQIRREFGLLEDNRPHA